MPKTKITKRGNKSNASPSLMLTTGEACQILHIHGNTLRRWSKKRLIMAYRIGPHGDRRFKREDIVALLAEANPLGLSQFLQNSTN
jgi:excisionase family DNA binding protein